MDWDDIKAIRGLKSVTTLSSATVLGNAISAVFWIYLARVLGEENYGELSYFISIAAIASTISLFGANYVIPVYTAKKNSITQSLFLFSLISSGVSAIILFIAFENFGMSIYAISYVIFNLGVAELIGRKLYKSYSKLFIIQKILFVTVSLVLYDLIGPQGVLLGYSISFLPFASRIFYVLKNFNFDFKMLKSKSGFIGNTYAFDLMRAGYGNIDKLLIGPVFGFALLGNYFLGLQILSILSLIPGAVFTYTLSEDASGNSTRQIKMLTIGVSVLLALVGIFLAPIFIPMILPEYGDALTLVPLLSIAIIPRTIYSMYLSNFLGNETSRYMIIGYIISVSTMVIGIFSLGEMFGGIGLAASYLISSIVQASYLVGVSHYQKIKNNLK